MSDTKRIDSVRGSVAETLNRIGSNLVGRGRHSLGQSFYLLATKVDSSRSVPWYNLGLDYKNTRQWQESLRCNQRAAELNPKDEAAWWNLGIAATALKNWPEARRAWRAYGITLDSDDGEVLMPQVGACVRLNPKSNGEVVWGLRLDPARIVIMNVPLPESGYRFHDIILNDGASNGSRVDERGEKVPVFDELALWQASEYSTFGAKLLITDKAAEDQLIENCRENQLGIEDWSTVRFMCVTCSRGNPGKHECMAQPLADGTRRFGFAAETIGHLTEVLHRWVASNPSCEYKEPQLLLSARRV